MKEKNPKFQDSIVKASLQVTSSIGLSSPKPNHRAGRKERLACLLYHSIAQWNVQFAAELTNFEYLGDNI